MAANRQAPIPAFLKHVLQAPWAYSSGEQCSYAGVISCKPLIGDKDREMEIYDIQKAVSLMWAVSGLSLVVCTGIFL